MSEVNKSVLAIIFVVLLIVMGFATFLEQAHGHAYAQSAIYHSWWFMTLWVLLTVFSLVILIKKKIWSRPVTALLHLSFILILAGAAITFFTGKEGTIHLRKDIPQRIYSDGSTNRILPFALVLDSFVIDYYPGTNAPADFISYVSVDKLTSEQVDKLNEKANNSSTNTNNSLTCQLVKSSTNTNNLSTCQLVNLSTNTSNSSTRQLVNSSTKIISMNNIAEIDGYRFYQSSFDRDLQGTVLSIKHDIWGIRITYTGYVLLALSMIACLLSRKESFRRLLRNSRKHMYTLLVMLFMVSPNCNARSLPTINNDRAEQVASMQVVYNNRIVPFNTLALDVIRKVYGNDSYHGLSAEQVIYGWMARPDVWQHEPIILVKEEQVRKEMKLSGKYASLAEVVRFSDRLSTDPAYRNLDEKIGILLMLANGTLIKPRPNNVEPLSDLRIKAELLYNAIPFVKIMFMTNLLLGIIAFFIKNKKVISHALATVSFLLILLFYMLRWYISGRIPMGNGYETMLFMALCIMLITIVSHKRFNYMLPFGFLLSGFTLLVAHLGNMNPQITPLMPVLSSPLLSLHVSVIMMAYALLAFTAIISLWALVTHRSLLVNIRILLYPAVFLLAIGIFLGAAWANISWGRYWSWDPKEVWALITMLIYCVPLHYNSIKILQNPKYYQLYMFLAFLTVMMTYFGVNYFLGGMHSYA